jgi:hypothetical protein
METPKGWGNMAQTADPNIREFSGTACNYLVPIVDDDASVDELEQLVETVRAYVLTQVPDIAPTVLAKLNLQQIVCEGIKRVQTVYTNDRARWPKGSEYKDFAKKINAYMKAGDVESAKAEIVDNPDLGTRWQAEFEKRQAEARAIEDMLGS